MDPLSSFGISGVAQGLNSLISGSDRSFQQQLALMSFNDLWQSSENERARDFQREMYNQQWKDYQSYNDPSSIAARLQSAGFSPGLALGQSSAPAGVSSMPNPSSPGHSASPSPDYSGILNPVNRGAESFSSISQGLFALAQAAKAGLESSKIIPKMESEITSNLAKADLDEMQTEQNRYELELRRKYGDKMLNAQVHELAMRAFQQEQLALYYAREEDVQKADEALKRAQVLHERAASRLDYEHSKLYSIDVDFRRERNQAEIDELRSRSGMQRSQAGYYDESAAFTRIQRLIMSNVQGTLEQKEYYELQNLIEDYNIKGWQSEAAEAAAEIAKTAASHAEAQFWKDFVLDIVREGVDAFLGYKNARSWERLSDSSQKNVERKIEQMKWDYGDKVQLEDRLPSGVKRTRIYRRNSSRYAVDE